MNRKNWGRHVNWRLVLCSPALVLAGCGGCDESGGASGDIPTSVTDPNGVAIACVGKLVRTVNGASTDVPFPAGYDPTKPPADQMDLVNKVACGYSAADILAARNGGTALQLPPAKLESIELESSGYCACGTDDASQWNAGCLDACNKILAKHPNYNAANGYACNAATIQAPPGAGKAFTCVHGSVIHFNGDFSQYVAGIWGNVHSHAEGCLDLPFPIPDYCVDDDDDSQFNGIVRYSMGDVSQGCGSAGCDFLISRLRVFGSAFSLDDTTVSDLYGETEDLLNGKILDNGRFTIPAGAGRMIAVYKENGAEKRKAQNIPKPITGRVDFASGAITLDELSLTSGAVVMTFSGFQSEVASSPPSPSFVPTGSYECNALGAARIPFDGTTTFDRDGDLRDYTWRLNGQNVASGSTATLTLPLGHNIVGLNATDQRLGMGMWSEPLDVVDTTPPAWQAAPVTDLTSCEARAETFALTPPAVADVCTGVAQIQAWLLATTGTAAFPPRQLDYAHASLPGGEHTIKWIARDGAGNESSTQQTVRIGPALLATGTFSVRDGAHPVNGSGAPASLGILGSGMTSQVGVNAGVGEILTLGSMFLQNNAHVFGRLRAAGSVTLQQGAVVDGGWTQLTTVPLGGTNWLAPFSNTVGSDLPPIESGKTVVLSGAAYGRVSIHSGGRAIITRPVTQTRELWVEPGATLELQVPNATVVARDTFVFRGVLDGATGTEASTFVSFGNEVIIERVISGVSLIAPSSKVKVATAANGSKVRLLVGKDVEIEPGVTLVCDRGSTAP